MKKALVYKRVSTEEQATEGRHSLKTQEDLCCKAIIEGGKFELADNGIYDDPGRSATNMNRPGLQDLLIRVQEDKSIGAVFVLDTDRLARNVNDHTTIKAILKKHEVILVSISQPGIEDTPEGNFMDTIIAGVNQLQSQITSRKTLKSLENRFGEGWWITKAPIGYLNAGEKGNDDKRIIIVDPIRGPLVTELFKLYATNSYSLNELRDELYEKGLVGFNGKKPAHSMICRLIQNPFYYGEMHWRGIIKEGNHIPLVTKELFDACQRIKDEHNNYACRRRKYTFLLRGFVYSATTGLRYTAENHETKKNKSYYRASGKEGVKAGPDDLFIPVPHLEKQVEDLFDGIEFSETFINKLVERVKAIYQHKKKTSESDKSIWTAKKLVCEQRLERAEEKLISGVITDEDFTRIKNRLREDISIIDKNILKIESNKNIKVDIIQQVLGLVRNIGEAYKKAPFELKRVYLGLFWTKFEVSKLDVVSAIPSPIIEALMTAGTICLDKRQKPLDMQEAYVKTNPVFRDAVKIRNFRGG
jgi:site-specific DNA recombinase